jgi:hypothetical protein
MKDQITKSLFWCVFFLFLILFGWTCHYHLLGAGILRPVIMCSEQVIDLGEISSGKPFEYEVMITNAGVRSLKISEVRSGCAGCIDILSFPHQPIPPNQPAKIHFALVTKSLRGKTRKSFLVKTNDPVTPVYVIVVDAVVKNEKIEDSHESLNNIE